MNLLELKWHLKVREYEYKLLLLETQENSLKIDLKARLEEVQHIYNLI